MATISTTTIIVLAATLLLISTNPCIAAWGFGSDPGKVLLKDVQVLTLRTGQMTTGRRSSPVSQLTCVGGSAAGKFNPQVVQCYNRGWDGVDVQWECKSDMDNLYRFGTVEVVCEGYAYPDDPYILKGSCGLEYTLDYTKEGHDRDKRSSGNYDYGYGSNSYSSYGGQGSYKSHKWSGLGDLIVLGCVGIVLYALYKTCLSGGQEMGDRQYSSTGSDYPGGGNPGGGGWFNPGGGGHNQGYNDAGYDASCGAGQQRRHGTGGGGGFWSGMATGGLLGYMFGGGNRGYNGYGNRGYNRGWGGWGGGGYGGTGGGFGGGGGSSGSSGTRSASGFGGTRRR